METCLHGVAPSHWTPGVGALFYIPAYSFHNFLVIIIYYYKILILSNKCDTLKQFYLAILFRSVFVRPGLKKSRETVTPFAAYR